jgi:hypothetical protein
VFEVSLHGKRFASNWQLDTIPSPWSLAGI